MVKRLKNIKIKLTNQRTKRFHAKTLQEQFKNTPYLNLRIITIELDNGEKETLLTNLPETKFKTEEFKQLYHLRWGIETNYNTMKNRLNIENYTGKRKITIEQDIYSKFLKYNIFQHYETYLTLLINKKKRKSAVFIFIL